MASTDLRVIAAHLEGLEETIIHRLIDRAQFRHNPEVYVHGASGFPDGGTNSLFDLRLLHQERMDAVFGRFVVPEEQPYHATLPQPARRVGLSGNPLDPHGCAAVNRVPEIVSDYLAFVPLLCESGDDGQYGSSVEHDVLAVQAISRRVHYGALYVGESKYRANPDRVRAAASGADEHARSELIALITRQDVEERILLRVAEKVDYVQASLNPQVRRRVDPDIVLQLYRDTIIPLTKEGEVDYLIARAFQPPGS